MRPKKIILIVSSDEQESSERNYLLQIRGYAVLAASSGQEAVDLFAEASVDLVLCDLSLVDTIGTDCVRRLKRIAKHVPMILLCRCTLPDFSQVHPADALLSTKAMRTVELLERIKVLAARKRGPRPGTPRPRPGGARWEAGIM